ncbi:MAG: hypothetical protein H7X92_01660 [Chitinophagales bacterium]|nr:hypothetical protein [Hyphomicrobiales bacterium]
MQNPIRTYNVDSISAIQRRLGITAYPLWMRYLGAAILLLVASGALLYLGQGGGLTLIDAPKYAMLVGSLLFIGRALWRVQRKESNLYYGNLLSSVSLLVASRRERMRSTVIAALALVFGVAFLCTSVSALLYALASDGVYNPFKGAVSLGSVSLFIIDQALKGVFFDAMEIFGINVGSLTVDPREKWFFGAFLVLFRLFFSVIVIGAFIAYVFKRAMKLAGYKIDIA